MRCMISRTPMVKCHASLSRKRLDSIKADVKSYMDQRTTNSNTLNAALRDAFKLEFELRKQLLEKFAAIAKEDCDTLAKNIKNPIVDDAPANVTEVTEADEVFYEP